jgi:hypothetical protein
MEIEKHTMEKKHTSKKDKTIKDKSKKDKSKKDKSKKDKSKNDFGLFNALEFSQLNNNLTNDLLNVKIKTNKHKSSKQPKHKHKSKKDKNIVDDMENNINSINKAVDIISDTNNIKNNFENKLSNNSIDSDDTEYLEKKLVKNNSIIERKNLILTLNDNDNNNNNNVEQEKNIVNVNNNKTDIYQSQSQYKNTVNSLIQNEVIWYSDDLDSEELEKKFKTKFNKPNEKDIIEEINGDDENIKDDMEIIEEDIVNHNEDIINYNEDIVNHDIDIMQNENNNNIKKLEFNTELFKICTITNEVEKYFTNKPELTICKKICRRIVDCKKCILECKKIDFNIFVCDTSCDPNCSAHKLFNNNFGLTHLNDVFFVSDGKTYIPEVVEIYLNENILLKRIYSDVTKNIKQSSIIEEYIITYESFHLFTDAKITIKIIDSKQIDAVYFNTYFEKIEGPSKNCYLKEEIPIEMICLTQELLHEGTETDIKICTEYGYYRDIYIICENIIDNIKSISLINTDVILFNSIPTQLLEPQTNSITYTLKFSDNCMSGLKIDSNNWINIKLDKINPNKKIKIYGNKLSIIHKLPLIKNN